MSPHFRKKRPNGTSIFLENQHGSIHMLVVSMESVWWLWTWSPVRWFSLLITPTNCGSEMLHLLSSCELSNIHEIVIILGISLPIATLNNYLGWQLALIFITCVGMCVKNHAWLERDTPVFQQAWQTYSNISFCQSPDSCLPHFLSHHSFLNHNLYDWITWKAQQQQRDSFTGSCD